MGGGVDCDAERKEGIGEGACDLSEGVAGNLWDGTACGLDDGACFDDGMGIGSGGLEGGRG